MVGLEAAGVLPNAAAKFGVPRPASPAPSPSKTTRPPLRR